MVMVKIKTTKDKVVKIKEGLWTYSRHIPESKSLVVPKGEEKERESIGA